MEAKYLRDYDPQIVTNVFAIGECIEWTEHLYKDENGNIGGYGLAGIIKKITPHTVLVQLVTIDKEIRIEKDQLVKDVLDLGLKDVIEASIGQGSSKKSDDVLHDAYRLRDPCDKAVFYVGISKNIQRRYKQHLACSGLNFKLNIRIQEILQSGLLPELELIEHAMEGFAKAREREKFWIAYHVQQGDTLMNIAEMDEVE